MSIESRNDAPAQAPATEAAGKPKSKVIKRYSNRKLYDTDRSKYVTLDEIAKMIKAGEEITIIDNESKEDLTSVTLTQIIYEEEKRESRMPLGMLRNLIQTGGTSLQEFFDKQVKAPALDIRETVEKSIEKNVDEIAHSAQQIREAATRSVTGITESARRMFSKEERRTEEFRKASTILLDHLEQRVEQRITDVRNALAQASEEAQAQPESGPDVDLVAVQRERLAVDTHVAMLRERIAKVQAHIDALQKAGREDVPPPSEAGEAPEPPEGEDPQQP